jgi:hypothetical protein
MNRRILPTLFLTAGLVALVPAPAVAAGHTVEAGQTLALKEDIVLSGDDSLEIKGTADRRCTLLGNGHRIRSQGAWTGSVRIRHCDLRQLGAPAKLTADGSRIAAEFPALEVAITGKGVLLVEHCVFDESAAVHVQNDGDSTTVFRGNTIRENTLAHADKDVAKSSPCFVGRGRSPARKRFQGNRIERSAARFAGPNWLVGGDTDADSNICIGLRVGLFAEGEGTVVRGNYLHLRMPITKEFPYYSQVSTFSTSKGALGEHNVIRDGEWIVRFVEGEFRYNVVTDIIDHDLMQNGSNGRIHHNLFDAGRSDSRPGSMFGCIAVINPPAQAQSGEGIEIFNNVFDGGGWLNVPAVEVSPGAFVKSLRNNVFFNFAHKDRYYKGPQGMIRAAWNDESAEKKPARLGYADYNLFYSPKAPARRNYLLSVAGKVERKDAGFGRNDVPRGGQVDEQADPKFQGPIPDAFPFADDDIQSGKVTVSQILAHYRKVYSPAADSPLPGAGDPADGKGTHIGAIGPGPPSAADPFGRFGRAGGNGQDKPATPAEEYKALRKEYDTASSSGVPLTDAERLKFVGQAYKHRHALAAKFLELAEKYPNDPIALDALVQAVWQVNTTPWPVELVGEDPARARAFELLQRDHLLSDRLGPLCQRISYGFCKEYETFLRAVLAKNPHHNVQAAACVSLGHFLNNRLQRIELCKEQPELAREFAGLYGKEYFAELLRQDKGGAVREIEAVFKQAAEKYGDVKLPGGEAVAERARAELFELLNLSVGKKAPDIEGEDQDGKRLKLSDYRGKVVLLDFWSFV